jgi:hypothetical protein
LHLKDLQAPPIKQQFVVIGGLLPSKMYIPLYITSPFTYRSTPGNPLTNVKLDVCFNFYQRKKKTLWQYRLIGV